MTDDQPLLEEPEPPPQPALPSIQPSQFPPHWAANLDARVPQLFAAGALDPVYFDMAIRHATILLESRIRELCDAPPDKSFGTRLTDFAFNPDSPRGPLLPDSVVGAEAKGLQSLFSGAILQIRNPVGHRLVGTYQMDAWDSIGFINYLLRTANKLAVEKYVHPFLPEREKFRAVQAIKRVDINGDGQDEFVVLIGESEWNASGRQGRILVLKPDLSATLPGTIPLLKDAAISPSVAVGDLDGDGVDEVVAGMVVEGTPARTIRGVALDHDEGKIRAAISMDGVPLESCVWPFEIVRRMETAPEGRIVSYVNQTTPTYIRYVNGTLTRDTTTLL